MAEQTKRSQSEIDGVQYRRAKIWQIVLAACNAFVGMSVYSLIGMAGYSASVGYGISTALVGVILTGTRIFDGITDPLVAFLYDKVNTKFGKLRVLLIGGFVIEAAALLLMFDVMSSRGFGWAVFTLLYILYVIGYTITNMTAQTFPAIMTNDPKQRPTIGVWNTAFNYLVPMVLSIVLNMGLLRMFGGQYNQAFLSAAVKVVIAIGTVGVILVCIGIAQFDKPECYGGIGKQEPLKLADIISTLKGNRALQCYIAANASDKLAQQTASQAVVNTMLLGILIGDMGLGTMLSVAGMVPSIIFAAFGAKYAGKHGSKRAIVMWTKVCMAVAAVFFLFFVIIDPSSISKTGPAMILFIVFQLCLNGAKMCVTTGSNAFMADTIDYELDRSGKYIPAVVTGTYSLIDKLISSFSAMIATGAIALIGYRTTVPQPDDASTPSIFWMTMAIYFGLPMIGWLVTLIAMRSCPLDREEMVNVQKRIAAKKEEALAAK